jgi:hypothetical protein
MTWGMLFVLLGVFLMIVASMPQAPDRPPPRFNLWMLAWALVIFGAFFLGPAWPHPLIGRP